MKKILALLLAGVMMFSLAACGTEEFDAKGYVQSALDAKYHKEYEAYAESCKVTVEEAKAQLEGEFYDSLEAQIAATGIAATDEEIAKYVQMESDLRDTIQYEVKDAVKDDENNFTVDVVITPVDAYSGLNDVFATNLQNAVLNGAGESDYMKIFLDSFQTCISEAKSVEAVTYTFHVTHEKVDGNVVYSLSEDEVMEFDLIATCQQ